MKLMDWLKAKKKKKFKISDYHRKIGVSSNPIDYYFVIFQDPEGIWDKKKGHVTKTHALITPIKYFEETGYCWACSIKNILDLPGLSEDTECIVSAKPGWPQLDAAGMHELLLDMGFVWSEKFANRMAANVGSTVYIPGVEK